MATRVEKSVVVDVPVETAYNQWTQFEEFPHFMGGISEVRQLDDTTLHWVAEIGGVKREWRARILEQVPNQKVAWAATEGATNAGAVHFMPIGAGQTTVRLELEYEPEGLVETVGDKVGVVERRAEADLEKFKSFIEDAGYATGAWRGTVPGAGVSPGVEAAEASRGDSGKSGLSGKAIAAGALGAAAAAAGVAAAVKAKSGSNPETEVVVETDVPVTPVITDPVVTDAVPVDPVLGETDPLLDESDPVLDGTDPLPPEADPDRRL
jgi:carbon monoxide dehydrogenase subunit G